MSPERGDMGARTNHRQGLLARGHGFESGGRHFSTYGTRWYASRYSYDTGKFIKHHLPEGNRKPEDKDKGSEENKQFDPGGKGEKPPPWNAAVMVSFYFMGGTLGHGKLAVCASCSLSVCACLSVRYLLFYQVITVQRAEKHERRRGSSR